MSKQFSEKFTGVFMPAIILLDEELSLEDRFLWSIINSLQGAEGFYGKNEYLSQRLNRGERTIQRCIKHLKDKGYLRVVINKLANTRRIWAITPCIEEPTELSQGDENPDDLTTKMSPPDDKNVATTIIDNNKEDSKDDNPPSKEDVMDKIIDGLIDTLNSLSTKNYRKESKYIRGPLRARLAEGYTEEEIRYVIRNKHAQWANDPKMKFFFRPKTLFGPENFEGYVTEPEYTPPVDKNKPTFIPPKPQSGFREI